LALQEMRNAARELDDLDAARELALRVGEHLAMLARDERRDLVEALVEQLLELEQDARAFERRSVGPARECSLGGRDGSRDGGFVGETRVCNRLSRRRVEHGVRASASQVGKAVDVVRNDRRASALTERFDEPRRARREEAARVVAVGTHAAILPPLAASRAP